MIYEEFKPFLLAACFPCDQHHKIIQNRIFFAKMQRRVSYGNQFCPARSRSEFGA